eukprot:UN23272
MAECFDECYDMTKNVEKNSCCDICNQTRFDSENHDNKIATYNITEVCRSICEIINEYAHKCDITIAKLVDIVRGTKVKGKGAGELNYVLTKLEIEPVHKREYTKSLLEEVILYMLEQRYLSVGSYKVRMPRGRKGKSFCTKIIKGTKSYTITGINKSRNTLIELDSYLIMPSYKKKKQKAKKNKKEEFHQYQRII